MKIKSTAKSTALCRTLGMATPTQVYIAIDGNAPPQQLSMGGGARQPATGVPTMSNSMFQNDAITVQQTTRGCFKECLGCEAKSEYRVFPGMVEEGQPRAENIPQMGHLLEESSCFCRFCFADKRGFTMKLAEGSLPAGEEGAGPVVMIYEKPFSFPICCNVPIPTGEDVLMISMPCCCLLPSVETKTPQGQFLGRTDYACDTFVFVPKFAVYDANQKIQYRIRPETCCGGCCVNIRCGGPGKRFFPCSCRTEIYTCVSTAAACGVCILI